MTALPLLKVTLVFTALVFAIRKKVPIGVALIGGGLVIGLFQAMPVIGVGREVASIATSSTTAEFVGVIAFVVALSVVLQKSGQIQRLTRGFRNFFASAKVSLAMLPTLIGLLPMPGGALFSAPMVQAGSEGLSMQAEQKTAVNYWFRHVLVYSWPIYPSILLVAQLSNIELKWIALAQVPLTLVAIAAGTLFLLRGVKHAAVKREGSRGRAAGDIFMALLPIVLLIGVHLATGWKVVWCVGIGFAFSAIWQLLARNVTISELGKGLFLSPRYLGMLTLGMGAVIFAEMMQRSGAILGVTEYFISLGLPALVLVVVLPFIVSFFSGMNVVFVTTTFPILLGFSVVSGQPLPYLVLGFAAGWCGTMLSPVHSCLTLSSGYFCSDLGSTIKRILAPAGVTLATGGILLFAYLQIFK